MITHQRYRQSVFNLVLTFLTKKWKNKKRKNDQNGTQLQATDSATSHHLYVKNIPLTENRISVYRTTKSHSKFLTKFSCHTTGLGLKKSDCFGSAGINFYPIRFSVGFKKIIMALLKKEWGIQTAWIV